MSERSWIDTLITKFDVESHGNGKHKKQMLEYLKEDYVEIAQLNRIILLESEQLAYRHLSDELTELVKEKQEHADKIAGSIKELGGEAENPEDTGNLFPTGDFQRILDKESEQRGRLAEHENFAEDYGFGKIAELLRHIREENLLFVEKLERILMRFNAEI